MTKSTKKWFSLHFKETEIHERKRGILCLTADKNHLCSSSAIGFSGIPVKKKLLRNRKTKQNLIWRLNRARMMIKKFKRAPIEKVNQPKQIATKCRLYL